jgi:predicted GNAT family N-acyltransferase
MSLGKRRYEDMPRTIRRAVTGEDRDRCYLIRMEVFVEEQKVPPWEEMDHFDEEATHYLAEENGKAVGTARLVDKGDGVGKIGRVAVLRGARGTGVGRDLMRCILDEAGVQFHSYVLDAQVQVIPFYERLGFVAEGDVFLDAGIEHRRMWLRRERDT